MNTASERTRATSIGQLPAIQPRQQTKASSGTTLRPAQRHTVRLALFSGAVIAAIIGAQALALLDNSVTAEPTPQAIVIPANANQ